MEARDENRLTFALCTVCLALLAWGAWPSFSVRSGTVAPDAPELTVSVAGAVQTPGTYLLPWGARVGDLLERAGGLLPDADPALVRPAEPLSEGEAVVVPTTRTAADLPRVSLNRSEPSELETLPGIGPVLAVRIVTGRPYRSVDDLEAVPGIGPATLDRLRPLVTL